MTRQAIELALIAGLIVSCAATPAQNPQTAAPVAAPAVREGMWPIRDTRLFVRDVGPKDAPALVVVHGGPGGNHRSLRLLEALAPAFRVVLYDQRGTGESDRLAVSPTDPSNLARLSLEQNVEDLEALRQRIGQERISLIGHSWGGALAVFYAAAYPERVDKLIVYSGGPETADLSQQKREAHEARLTDEERRRIGPLTQQLGEAAGRGAPQAELDRLFVELAAVMLPSLYCQRPAAGPGDLGRGGFGAAQVAGRYSRGFDYDLIASGLARLRRPALLIWGRCEPSPQERLSNLLDYLPDARLIIFDKSGHNAMEEQPELFFRAVRAFLAGEPLSLPAYGPRAELPGAPFSRQRRQLDRWGDRLTRWLFEGKLEELSRLFSPQLKQALPPDKLAAFHTELTVQLGAEKKLTAKLHTVLPGTGIYRRMVRFANADSDKEVSWTLAGLEVGAPAIASFYVRDPPQPASSGRLAYQTKTTLRLPFNGRWMVAWGGRTVAENYHAQSRRQQFATDFFVVRDGKTHSGDGKSNEQYHCFGAPILAAGPGAVVAAVGGEEDRAPGTMIDEAPLGNHVIIDHGNGEFSFYGHLKRGSVAVKPGQRVEGGALLGHCGNSGRSSEPHLHFHLQDSAKPHQGEGLPAQFQRYLADGSFVERCEPRQGQIVEVAKE